VTFLEAVFLGFLQGITEFLPVSSSGHLVIARQFLNIQGIPVLFDVLLHISTLLVVCLVFRKTLLRLVISFIRILRAKEVDADDRGSILAIIVATFVTAILGLGIESLSPGENPVLVAVLFLVTGIILFLPRIFSWGTGDRTPGIKTGLIVGAAQGLGVFPGISRSGITITASLGAGLSRERAGEFAFIISIPAILGALLLTLRDMGSLSGRIAPASLAGGMLASFVVGYASLLLLLRLVRKGNLHYFSLYLLPLGLISLLIL
jgi:undecaprenyl-diphosphatase